MAGVKPPDDFENSFEVWLGRQKEDFEQRHVLLLLRRFP